MKNTEYNEHRTCQMWNAETKSFETWHIGECDICGEELDHQSGECKQYKCWIS